MRSAVYARLSQDDGTRESIKRQIADCEQLAERHGWTVADRYVDRGVSAFQPGTRREQFERLLADVAAGVVDSVVVWKLDRLARRPADYVRFTEACATHDVRFASVMDGMDTTTAIGQAMAEIATSMAQLESSNTSVRVRRAKRASRERGEPHHGGRRAFGHNRDGTADPAEAAAIRDATARLLAGENISSVARGWRDQGITTPNGTKPWATPHLRRLLLQPRLAGARVVDGELVATGAITPILTLDEHYELRAVLTDPARRTNNGRVHDHLLTGVLHCGICGSRMFTHKVGARPMYQCASRPHQPACGKVAVTARLADAHVEAVLLDLVDTPEVREALARREQEGANGETARRLDADRARLQALNDAYWLERAMPEREYRRLVGSLTDRIEQAEKALERSRARAGVSLGGVDLRAEWPLISLDTRRLILRLLVDRVECDPATKLGGAWQPQRLRVTARSFSDEQAGDLVSNR